MNNQEMIFRQGDVVIRQAKIPFDAVETTETVLAEGEVTGHAHRIAKKSNAKLFLTPMVALFIRVAEPCEIEHEEHESIILPMGDWSVNVQREYDWFSNEIRNVAD